MYLTQEEPLDIFRTRIVHSDKEITVIPEAGTGPRGAESDRGHYDTSVNP